MELSVFHVDASSAAPFTFENKIFDSLAIYPVCGKRPAPSVSSDPVLF
jgi:hypothetical protein